MMQISARLLPAMRIGDAWLSLDPDTAIFYLDTPEGNYEITGFRPGAIMGIDGWFQSMLGFMNAAAEAMRNPRSDNRDLFEPAVMWWCEDNASEIQSNLECYE